MSDGDINEYLRRLVAGQERKIEPVALQKFKELMGDAKPATQAEADEIPF